MLPGERLVNWIESLVMLWRDRLRGWMASWVERGLNELFESLEPEGIDIVKDQLAKIKDHPATPEDLKVVIDSLLAGKKPLPLLVLIPLAVLLFIPTITSIAQPLGNLLKYSQERVFHSGRMDPTTVIRAFWRGHMTEERMRATLEDHGLDELDRESIINVTKFYPAPPDLVRWQAREVFEPEMIARYGLDSEFGAIDKEPFYKAGMTDEQILNYWRAHWEHASWMQVVEMLHRGLMTEEEVYDWFRVVEIPPFWRQKLIDTAYTWPTRVDVRRWWDMRTIDEAELRRLYSGMGYRGVNLDNYVLWTKVYVAFPDLMARWTKGWITLDQVRSELTGLGMPAARVEEMIQMKIKPEEPERVEEGRSLTKTEIYKGVKKNLISWGEGIELLMDLGYDADEADYILAVNVGALEGSPSTFAEFKDWTTKYKKATGREAVPMPEEIKQAAAEVVKLSDELAKLTRSIEEEQRGLVGQEVLPEAVTRRLTDLQVARNRVTAELERVKSEYERKLAEWRRGLT